MKNLKEKNKTPQIDDFLVVPEICPKINRCKQKIDRIIFESECNDSLWIFCEHAEEYAKKYLKLPKDWMKIKKLEKVLGKDHESKEE